MKTVPLLAVALLFALKVMGQSEKKNSAYFEFAGTAIVYSINYDRLISKGNLFHLNARVGFATLLKDEPFIIPMEMTGSIGRNNRFFEFGPGYALTGGRDDGLGSVRLGYRSEKGNTLFRIAFILFPSFASGDITGPLPWAGVSYGFRF